VFGAHPINFCSYTTTDSTGTHQDVINNDQILGVDHLAKAQNFLNMASKWRVAYAGLTIVQDGPAQQDQGTIAVCQTDLPSTVYNPCQVYPAPSSQISACKHARAYTLDSIPNYSTIQNMPNAYLGKSKDGAYIPLKLTKTSQFWHSWSDECCLVPAITGPVSSVSSYDIPAASATGAFPFYDLITLNCNTTTGLVTGGVTVPYSNDTVANICIQNVSVATRFSLYFRVGYEIQVMPGTPYTPQQRMSPAYDPAAIAAYFEVSRQLKDAYPSDYNLFGTLWKVISSIISRATPFIERVPVYGAPISVAANAVRDIGDQIYATYHKTTKKPSPPAEKRAPKKLTITRPQRVRSVPVRFAK